jgi:hypothetical protein
MAADETRGFLSWTPVGGQPSRSYVVAVFQSQETQKIVRKNIMTNDPESRGQRIENVRTLLRNAVPNHSTHNEV